MNRFTWLRGVVEDAKARDIPARWWLTVRSCSPPDPGFYDGEAAATGRLMRAVFDE